MAGRFSGAAIGAESRICRFPGCKVRVHKDALGIKAGLCLRHFRTAAPEIRSTVADRRDLRVAEVPFQGSGLGTGARLHVSLPREPWLKGGDA